jgi:pre-mRNA-splicing factor ATP-dependent RNA helicase DHX38/PRP16
MDTHDAPNGNNEADPFVHNIAIKLSRALNTINPNDLLARHVIDIVGTSSAEGFIKGVFILLR